jgi:nitroreductase
MELDKAINERISVRAYLEKPVEKSVIEEILNLAVKAPSWGNTQPWELAIVGGQAKNELAQELQNLVMQGATPNPDYKMPQNFTGVYMDRYRMTGKRLFELAGIARDDAKARMNQFISMFNGFGAPNLVYIIMDEILDTSYSVFDAGAVANYIALLATSRGLGTCLMAALAMYPEPVRKCLNLPSSKKIVLGLSLGYPDMNSPVNNLKTDREELCRILTWRGMD